ncbi:hypothetical protein [Arthrobacter sp. ISL-30]|uniref:hypothetical protein n=1 Tax=Arthrobacter sp. ISL-30 TaxID=2819109 RepID=UPI001BE7D5BE|nr:hypothetical protein [Arthrobacter sp. ISL-30]MBT2512706.1 hypothetical protein [Arthrobacter sp. ISL-30]
MVMQNGGPTSGEVLKAMSGESRLAEIDDQDLVSTRDNVGEKRRFTSLRCPVRV